MQYGFHLVGIINWNMTVADLSQISGKRGLNLKAEREITRRYADDLCIKITRQTQPISSLSGSNQWKVMLGRRSHRDPQVLILEEPTHGIAVNAKAKAYNLIIEYMGRDNGVIVRQRDRIQSLTGLKADGVAAFVDDPVS